MKKFVVILFIIIAAAFIFYFYQIHQIKIQEQQASDVWHQLPPEKTITQLEQFLNEFPRSSYSAIAKSMYDDLKAEEAWKKALALNTLAAYQDFEMKYPESKFQAQLNEKMHSFKIKQAWAEAIASKTIQALTDFQKAYPRSPYQRELEKRMIDLEVTNIFAGQHGTLPPAQKVSHAGSSTGTTINIENQTYFTLTVMYSGSQSKKLVLKPRSEGFIVLTNGHYRVAASVNSADVLPFAGTQQLEGGVYSSIFYIM